MGNLLKQIGISIVILIVAFLASWVYYAPSADMKGTWKTEGYGLAIDVGAVFIDVYQVTDMSCRRDMRIPAHLPLIKALEGAEFAVVDGRFKLGVEGTLNPIFADRTAALPSQCLIQTRPAPDSATYNFDVFWQAMHEHYAFFDLHGVDWDARKSLRPSEDADDATLWAAMSDALNGLDDGHLYIHDGTTVHSPSVRPDWHADRHLARDTTRAAIPEGVALIRDSGVLFGFATPDIAYISIDHMNVDSGIGQSDFRKATAVFAELAPEIANAKGIIIDIRYNPGGSDDIALAYASYFAATETPAFSKTTRTASGYTPATEVFTPIGPRHLSQPTVLLTGPYTGSAAEIFNFAMRNLPQVTTMGTATGGGLSDVLNFTLPNGWQLGLSHQIYLAPNGAAYEGIGIPPKIEVPIDIPAFHAGRDTQLEAAIAHLQKN